MSYPRSIRLIQTHRRVVRIKSCEVREVLVELRRRATLMAAVVRAAVARVAAVAAARGLRHMSSSLFADLDLKREPDLPPKVEPSTKLFVAGLNKETTPDRLREAFSMFGQVVDAHIVMDRLLGLSRGFGFVRYATIEEAEAGKKGLDGKFLDGWVILADFARPKQPARVAPVNLQSSLPSHRINHSNVNRRNPQCGPLQSETLSDSLSSYDSQPVSHLPYFSEYKSLTSAAPVNPQAPPVSEINLNVVPSGSSQFQSSNKSWPSYEGSHSNGQYNHSNKSPGFAPSSFSCESFCLNNAAPSFNKSTQGQPPHQSQPDGQYSNMTPSLYISTKDSPPCQFQPDEQYSNMISSLNNSTKGSPHHSQPNMNPQTSFSHENTGLNNPTPSSPRPSFSSYEFQSSYQQSSVHEYNIYQNPTRMD